MLSGNRFSCPLHGQMPLCMLVPESQLGNTMHLRYSVNSRFLAHRNDGAVKTTGWTRLTQGVRLLLALLTWPAAAFGQDGTYKVTESWSVTLTYSGFGDPSKSR